MSGIRNTIIVASAHDTSSLASDKLLHEISSPPDASLCQTMALMASIQDHDKKTSNVKSEMQDCSHDPVVGGPRCRCGSSGSIYTLAFILHTLGKEVAQAKPLKSLGMLPIRLHLL